MTDTKAQTPLDAAGEPGGSGLVMVRVRENRHPPREPSQSFALEPKGSSGEAGGIFRLSAVADMHTNTVAASPKGCY